MSFTLTINDTETKIFEKSIKIIDLIPNNDQDFAYIAALVNGRIRELDYSVHYDATIKLLTLKDTLANGIYERGIRYLFAMAVFNLYRDTQFRLSYSISRSIFANKICGDLRITNDVVRKIENEMKRIVSLNLPFDRIIITNEEATKLFKEHNLDDKLATLKYRPEKTVHLYKVGNYFNYMYGKMVPSTGYLKDFKLRYYHPGILIQYPRSETNGEIPPFIDEPMFQDTLEGANAWSRLVHLSTVADINEYSALKEGTNLINVCENKHNRMLVQIGDKIQKDISNIRLICIAGPSSSGKTTFADRLTLELVSRGINPIRISIDDYYKRREEVPLDEEGNKDFETLDALDIETFNENILSLLEGEEVALPTYDFKTNSRHYDRKVKIGPHDPIVIEGIHALNEDLTPLIPKQIKYKIYISPQAQINLDNVNPISLTDIRLIRRIVRDAKYRNANAEETISMWPSVRRGEFKWIYKTQQDADFVFDSFLNYELCVMKKYAMPLLEKIDKDGKYGTDAARLIKLLKYFVDIDEKYIPCNSILKEFIGGSSYRDV